MNLHRLTGERLKSCAKCLRAGRRKLRVAGCTTAVRAIHADRELLSASKLIHDPWADITPVGERVLGPFRNRTEALKAERGWLLPSVLRPLPSQPRRATC